MVKPPVVHLAGMLRAIGRPIDTEAWTWLCDQAGQHALLAAERLRLGRQALARHLADARPLEPRQLRARRDRGQPLGRRHYSETETPDEALARALGLLGLAGAARRTPRRAARLRPPQRRPIIADWQQGPYRAMRQNGLLQLIGISPDLILQ